MYFDLTATTCRNCDDKSHKNYLIFTAGYLLNQPLYVGGLTTVNVDYEEYNQFKIA